MITAKEAKEISDRVRTNNILDIAQKTIVWINEEITKKSKNGSVSFTFKIESTPNPNSLESLAEVRKTLEEYGYSIKQVDDCDEQEWVISW